MPTTIFSAQLTGLEAELIRVEMDITPGLFIFSMVGLADKEVQEAKERIAAAIKNIGAVPPHRKPQRIIVSLAPADIKKEGPAFDLPIALGYLLASSQARFSPAGKMFVGELGLDGTARPIRGMLAIASLAADRGFEELYVPEGNGEEAAIIESLKVFEIKTLTECLNYLEGRAEGIPRAATEFNDIPATGETDLCDIHGQDGAKRALEIASAGGHNIIFQGPPGMGKTMLARALPGILPPLAKAEAIEITKVYSAAGLTKGGNPLAARRPFRAPHHTASAASIVGGGTFPRPGEISLAHRGVLFLDEFPEFQRPVLEALREPLEERRVTVSRMQGSVTYPANFILVASMNPCPCGNYGSRTLTCACPPGTIARYQRKISGPLLDRIDLHAPVLSVPFEKMGNPAEGDASSDVRARVTAARAIQRARFAGEGIFSNSEMGVRHVKQFSALDGAGRTVMERAVAKYELSARGYHRVLKVARTIADLAGAENVQEPHLLEALRYRPAKDS